MVYGQCYEDEDECRAGNANKTQHIGKISRSFGRQQNQLVNGRGLIYRAIRWVFVRLFVRMLVRFPSPVRISFHFRFNVAVGKCGGVVRSA